MALYCLFSGFVANLNDRPVATSEIEQLGARARKLLAILATHGISDESRQEIANQLRSLRDLVS